MTRDIQQSSFDKRAIDMIATTIQHQVNLMELDSMFEEAEENLNSIYQNPRVSPMTREHAFRLYEKMVHAQKKYDSYFAKGRISELEFPRVKRPLAYQIAAYHVFIQHNKYVLKEAGVILEKKHSADNLETLARVEDTNPSHAKKAEEIEIDTGKWIYK